MITLKLLFLLAVAGLLLAALSDHEVPMVLGWLLGMLLVAWGALEILVRRPLGRATRHVERLVRRDADVEPLELADDWAALGGHLTRVGEQMAADARSIAAERAARREADRRLGESQERYALAIRGSGDGLWEWNVRAETVHLSPRWKSMLGYRDDEIEDSLEAWRGFIHPDDRGAVDDALQAHLGGRTPRFESEHRVIHRDGAHRWVLSRGFAIRHASGAANRVVGLDTDITPFKRVEEVMLHVAEGTAGTTGEAFFRSLVQHFAAALGVKEAFITQCVDTPPTRVRALAFWSRGRFLEDIEFDLAGTPCEPVFSDRTTTFYPRDLERLYPKAATGGRKSYLGVPILDSLERPIGHLAFYDDKEMGDEVMMTAVYRIFAARAAAEFERRRVQSAVSELAERLHAVRGEACFRELVRQFAQHLGVREAFVCECCDDPPTRVRMLAHWNRGGYASSVEFDLAGTSCEQVIRDGRLLFCPSGVGERWPRERQYDRESYLGMACTDAKGRVIGHIACMDGGAMRDELPDQAILKLFSERAALELERKRVRDGFEQVLAALEQVRGEDALREIARNFCHLMRVREAIVTECSEGPEPSLRVLAWWRDGRFEGPVEYPLAGTTCEETIREGRICVYPEKVGELFPPARPFGRESYLGVPCFDSRGRVIGHIACFDEVRLSGDLPDETVLRLFARQAALEIERRRLGAAMA